MRTNGFLKIWEVENKGKYSVVNCSASKKNKTTNEYETTFSNKFVRFIGQAHEVVKNMKKGDSVKLIEFEVESKYDKEKKVQYTNFLVFKVEDTSGGNSSTPKSTPKTDTFEDDSLPF